MIRPLVLSSICHGLPNLVSRLSVATRETAGMSPRSTRKRRIRSSETPTCPISSGRSNRARYCRFQQVSRKSLSKTVIPCSIWSSAICRRSRLCWSASVASSSRRKASLERRVVALEKQRQDQPCRGRADGARQQLFREADDGHACRFAAVQSPAFAQLEGLEGALRPLDAEIARDRVLQIVDCNRRSEAPQAGHRVRIARDEDRRLDAFERHRGA